jgi:hypothetical protein
MTNQHPLTDKICEQIRDSIPKLRRDEQGHILSFDGQRILDGMFEELFEVSNAEMRTAYDKGRDDQLEQVMEWLDEHLSNYSDAPWLGSCESILDLEDHLKKAMRPQEDS